MVVATTKEIVLLAASFMNDTNGDASSISLDWGQADMYLLPDPLFKVGKLSTKFAHDVGGFDQLLMKGSYVHVYFSRTNSL